MSLYAIFDNPEELNESSGPTNNPSSASAQGSVPTTSAAGTGPSSSSVVTPAGWNASNRIAFAPTKRKNHLQAAKRTTTTILPRASTLAAIAAGQNGVSQIKQGVVQELKSSSTSHPQKETSPAPAFKAIPGTYEDSPRNYDPNIPNDFEACRKEQKQRAREAREKLLAEAIQSAPRKDTFSYRGAPKQDSESAYSHHENIPEHLESRSHNIRHPERDDDYQNIDHNPHSQDYNYGPTRPSYEPRRETTAPSVPLAAQPSASTAPPRDLSGEEAYQRRMQLTQQRQQQNRGPNGYGRPTYLEAARAEGPTTYTKCSDPREEEPDTESNVILFTNMVSLAEVDDDLKEETVSECSKFGTVRSCIIHKVTHPIVPESQNVRIFVEFETVESACEAQDQMNGRFFGGRTVLASFFPLNRYRHRDLNPLLS